MIASIAVEHKKGEHLFAYNCDVSHSITGVYGPSGSGKSTLLNLLSGLETPNKGKIVVSGLTLFDSEKKGQFTAFKT